MKRIPPTLKRIIENATKPQSPEAHEAGRRFVLKQGTLGDYLEALNKKGRQ